MKLSAQPDFWRNRSGLTVFLLLLNVNFFACSKAAPVADARGTKCGEGDNACVNRDPGSGTVTVKPNTAQTIRSNNAVLNGLAIGVPSNAIGEQQRISVELIEISATPKRVYELRISSTGNLNSPISVTLPKKMTEDYSLEELKAASVSFKSGSGGTNWVAKFGEFSLTTDGLVQVALDSWGTITLVPAKSPDEVSVAVSSLTNQTVTLTGAPSGATSATTANIVVSGDGFAGYRYQLRADADAADCDGIVFPTSWTTLSTPITLSSTELGSDGAKGLCVQGKTTTGAVQSTPTHVSWSIDTTLPTVDVGVDVTSNSALTRTATISEFATLLWSDAGNSGHISFSSASSATTGITADADGVYTIKLTATDAAGNTSFDTFVYTKSDAPNVSAGSNLTVNAQTTLNGSTLGATSVLWTQVSGPGTVTFGSSSTAVTTATANTEGTYVLRLTATSATGNSSTSDMTLVWDTTPPSSSAGSDVSTTSTITRSATVSGPSTYQWSKVSGSGTLTFGTASGTLTQTSASISISTTISASADDTYVVRLTATDAAGNSSHSDFNLTWDATPPSVNVGTDVTANAQFTKSATVSGASTYQWSKVSGSGTLTFGSATSASTTVSASADAVYVIRLTATDALGNSSQADFNLTWDTTGPSAPSVTGTTPVITTTPTWNWTAGGGGNGTFRYKLDSSDFNSGSTTTTSTSFTAGSALSLGVHTLYVQEQETLGNWSDAGHFDITIVAPTSTPTATATDTATNTPTSNATNTPTNTSTNTPTNTPTNTATNTYTPTNTPTNTATYTPTPSPTPTGDNSPPVPGNSGTITASAQASSIGISWTGASDNVTNGVMLEYRAYYSTSNNLDSVANIEANGTPAGAYATITTSKSFTGLNPSTTYYFNVLVRDGMGNKAMYVTKTQATTADTTVPTVADTTLVATNISATGLTLNWPTATDNVTSTANLQYEVRKSNSSNMTSVSNFEANGAIQCSYSANLQSCNITGLSASNTYYFNVVVKDEAANKSIYSTLSVLTMPSTAANAGAAKAIGKGSQRKTFYDTVNGKHWVFYYNGTAIAYSYSADNVTWTAAGTLAYTTDDFSLAFKSVSGSPYVFVVTKANTYDIVVVRGSLTATSVTFDAEQTVFDGTSTTDAYSKPSVTLNSDDQLWVAAVHKNSVSHGVSYIARSRRSTNAGSGDLSVWQSLSSHGERSAPISDVAILPRTGSEIYLLVNSPQLTGYLFDGTSWSATNTGGSASWFTFPGEGLTGSAAAAAMMGSDLYIGGSFTKSSGSPGDYLLKWDGASWSEVGSGVNSAITAMGVVGTDLYVGGGSLTSAGGVAVASIAKWNGSSWSALGSGLGSGTVNVISGNGTDVYVGGTFTTAGGVTVNRIAKWNGAIWSALGTGMNNSVSALAFIGTDLYAGGGFTTAGGVSAARIAKWNGTTWSTFGTAGYFYNGNINALAVMGTTLYIGGTFSYVGGSNANCFAKWDGANFTDLGYYGGLNIAGAPTTFAVVGTNLYIASTGTLEAGYSTYVVRWNGTTTSAVTTGISTGGVSALFTNGTDVYAVGTYTKSAGSAADYVSKWNGTSWAGLTNSKYLDGNSVSAFATIGSDLYIAGDFTTVAGTSANRIAKWNGSSWSALGAGLNNSATALAVAGTDLYVLGSFTLAGSTTVSKIAKWNGTTWTALGAGIPSGSPMALAVIGTDLYVAGSFTTAGSTSVSNIAKWNGSAWSALGTGINNTVRALAVIDTDLYAAGLSSITSAGGVTVAGIAKWNGTAWSALGSGLTGGHTLALAVIGTDLYASGGFTTAGGTAISKIAKWDGSNWSALGTGINGTQNSALLAVGTDLYVAGDLTNAGGTTVSGIAKWDGTSWTALGSGVQTSSISALAYSGSSVYAGGSVTSVASRPTQYLAKWQASVVQGGLYGMAAVTDTSSGNVHAMIVNSSQVLYYSYSSGTWSSATTLSSSASTFMPSVSVDPNTGNIWAFWIEGGVVKYKKYSSGAWGSVTSLTASPVVPVGISSDFDLQNGVVKVMIQHGPNPSSIIVKTVN